MKLLLFPVKSQSGVVYKSVAYKKGKKDIALFCSLLNFKKWLSFVILFCIYPDYHWGNIAKKMLSKVGGSVKIYKRGMAKWGKLSMEGGLQTFPTRSTNLSLFAKSAWVFESISPEAIPGGLLGVQFHQKTI